MTKQFQLKLIVRRAPILASLQWFKHAWIIFKKAPLLWVQMCTTIVLISVFSQLHPILAIAGFLVSPFLTAGLYKAIAAVQQEQSVSFGWLFKPLQEPECRAILLRLGAVNMLVSIPLALLHQALLVQVEKQAVEGTTLLLFVILFSLCWMVFAYAVAIAYFLKEQRLLAVMQASFIACWRNIQALVVFGLLCAGLVLLTVPTMFLGLFLVLPLINIAFLLSFNEFFALQVKTGSDDAVLEV